MGVVFVLCAGGFTGGHSRGLHVCRVCVCGGGGGILRQLGVGAVGHVAIHTYDGGDGQDMYVHGLTNLVSDPGSLPDY